MSIQLCRKRGMIMREMVFVMGGPGSGKGTQCKILEKSKGYHHISTGDLVRKMLNEHKEAEIQNIRLATQQGTLLDDRMIILLVKDEISKHPDAPGFLIDGCPRTFEQAALFEKEIQCCDRILFFDVSEKTMRERMLHRGETESREDDHPATIEKRLKIYQEKTIHVIDSFKENRHSVFHKIDASGTVEGVAK